MSDVDAALARPATLCAFCPKMCRSACAVSEAEKRETVTPWAKMSIVHLGRTGQISLQQAGAQKALEACTGCGACVEQCAHGNPVGETLFAARSLAETPRSKRFAEEFKRTGDVKGRDLSKLIEGFPKNPFAKVAYFPGCARLGVDGAAGRTAVEKDLRAIEIAFGAAVPVTTISLGAQCCGYPVYADGNVELVEENLLRLAEAFSGHEMIVTPDPGCAHMFSTVRETLIGQGRGPGKGGQAFPTVVPLVEALGARADRFKGASAGLVVRYHDPCYLARRGRTFDAPRKLLEAATGQRPLEFVRHHDDADCAGGGGLYPVSNPDGAKEVARRRASPQSQGTEPADIVVTACPSARKNFERAGLRARDVVDVLLGEVYVAVIGFDLDGTLVDSVADIAHALNAALQEVGLPPHPTSAVRTFVGDGARMLVVRGLQYAEGRHGAVPSDADVDDVLARFRRVYGLDPVGQTRAFAGIDDALTTLAADAADNDQHVFVVVTNKPGVFARPIVDALFPGRFALVVGPEDLGCQKPDPAVLVAVAKRLGRSVDVFVGDGGTDIGVAQAAGIPSVGVTWGLKPDEVRSATVVIDRTEQLAAAILGLVRAR